MARPFIRRPASPVRQRTKPDRIRSWRSDAIRTPGTLDAAPAAADRLFPALEDNDRLRLARQLRRERVLSGTEGRGYDLARHMILARALGCTVADKERAPRE